MSKFIDSAINSFKSLKKDFDTALLKRDVSDLETRLKGASSEKEKKEIENELAEKKSTLSGIERERADERKKNSEKAKEDLGDYYKGELKHDIEELDAKGIPYSVSRRGNMVSISYTVDKNGNPIDRSKPMTDFVNDMSDLLGALNIWRGVSDGGHRKKNDFKIGDNDQEHETEQDGSEHQGHKNGEESKSAFNKAKKEAEAAGLIESIRKNSVDTEWYDDDRLMKAAATSLKYPNRKDVELCGSIPIGDHLPEELSSELLGDRINSAKESAKAGKTCLMGFQIGDNHWVGGAMAKDGKGNLVFLHNDPFGNEMHRDLRASLEGQGIKIVDMTVRQQNDGHNCGVYTADNLAKFVDALDESKKTGQGINELKEELGKELAGSEGRGAELREKQSKAIKSLDDVIIGSSAKEASEASKGGGRGG